MPSMRARSRLVFFFFQAEDGIRDYKVTGVQTCALPIYLRGAGDRPAGKRRPQDVGEGDPASQDSFDRCDAVIDGGVGFDEIGRASCRERVEGSGGGGAVEERESARGGWEAAVHDGW